ncbi:MAG: hypothetical protein H7070_10630 [Saprospiraceae bacterium]|nr:hypothetical protein [Pyrinomonadaceae bacterium]
MLHKIRITHLILAFGLMISMSATAIADTIRLKDGSIIKGKIVSFGGGKFTVSIGDGSRSRQMSFSSAEIDSIQFDSPRTTPEIVNAASRTPPTTAIEDDNDVIMDEAPPKTIPRVVTTDTTKVDVPRVTVKAKTTTSAAKPVEVGVKVLADNTANGWTNSGWVVKKGQKIRITGDGVISIGSGKTATPSGLSDLEDGGKLLKGVPTGALIAVIGDDNNEFIYLGSSREFIATRDGALFLGVNEGNLGDNSGAFNVRIEIDPA